MKAMELDHSPVKTIQGAAHLVPTWVSDKETLETAGIAPALPGILTETIWLSVKNGGLKGIPKR